MATKDDLVAFGQAHGLDVDSSMLKSEIEAVISDAGYDPTTLGESTMSDEPRADVREVDPSLSRDARYSSYSELSPERQEGEENPPPGRIVEQTLGTPSESEPES